MAPRYRPTLSAIPPHGWFVKESITLLAPDGQANVIVSSEPIDPSLDSAQYAMIQGQLLAAQFPRYVEHDFVPVPLLGRYDGFVREFSWTPPDGVRVTQIQFYCAATGRGYTGTATTPAAMFGAHELNLREALLSAVVEA
jgi:hypothetical protein